MAMDILSGKAFLLVTGASRGIGRQIAITLGSMLQEGSHVLLLATNLAGLKETAARISANVEVDTVSVNLATAQKDELHAIVTSSLKGKSPADFDRMMLIHNVGSMGDLTKHTTEMMDLPVWHNYFDLNLFMPIILNGVVMNIFDSMPNAKKTVVNITSLYGIQPGKLTGYYCTVKAAREMYFKVFALEYPEVNVLCYSPGPVETDMFHMVCDQLGDKETKQKFQEMREKKSYLTCEQTVNRLVTVLKERKYTSGDHVDYFDKL